jgi:hypothetical protein
MKRPSIRVKENGEVVCSSVVSQNKQLGQRLVYRWGKTSTAKHPPGTTVSPYQPSPTTYQPSAINLLLFLLIHI